MHITSRLASGQQVHATVRRLRKDRQMIDLEVNVVPLFKDGQPAGAYAIYKDISEEAKAAEHARQHSASMARLVKGRDTVTIANHQNVGALGRLF
jgi:hypothetical protein